MKNNRIFCIALAVVMSASMLTGCKPTIPEDDSITPSSSETTAVTPEKTDKSEKIEEKPVKVEETGDFAAPIGTNGDNDDMNSNLDVILSVKYGSEGQFYDSEAIYGYLKNKDTLIFDSPMFDLAHDYILSNETYKFSALYTLNAVITNGLAKKAEGKEMVNNALKRFDDSTAKTLLDRLMSLDVSKYIDNYTSYTISEGNSVKNESVVFAAMYKTVANYYNAKFFGTDFTAGTTTFEGDPELVYTYISQNGGKVISMVNTVGEPGFEMTVDSYSAAVIPVNTRYCISGYKNGLYQEYYKTDTFFLIPVIENDALMFKIDFVFSPTDYIYSYVKNPKYDENMKLIPKEIVTSEDGCVYFANN